MGRQGGGDDCSEAEEEETQSIYSEEESGSEVAEDASGGARWRRSRGDSCFGGDFGDDAATLARAAAWRRENPELAESRENPELAESAGRVLPPPLGQPRRRRE